MFLKNPQNTQIVDFSNVNSFEKKTNAATNLFVIAFYVKEEDTISFKFSTEQERDEYWEKVVTELKKNNSVV